MSNSSPDFGDKVEAALLGQMSEIADQISDSVLVIGAAVLLKSRDSGGGPSKVFGFIAHLAPPAARQAEWVLKSRMPNGILRSDALSMSKLLGTSSYSSAPVLKDFEWLPNAAFAVIAITAASA
jgi:hypothetical protein